VGVVTISGRNRRLLLGSTLALSGLLGYGRNADAACAVTVSPNYLCTGANVTTQTIAVDNATVTTAADFSVIAAAGHGIEISGDGAISFTDIHPAGDRSIITGVVYGLHILGTGAGTASPDSVTVNSNGTITGGFTGIAARNYGTGALSVTSGAGDVTGTTSYGIFARDAAGTGLTVLTGDGAVLGGQRGINALNNGSGALSVTTGAGDVTGTTRYGIFAINTGASTNLTVLTGDGAVTGGYTGIFTRNDGSGALSVTTGLGDVTGTTNYGIFARNDDGTDLTVLTGDGAVLGGNMGIYARNLIGTDALSVTTGAGAVTGTSGYGIYAHNYGTSLTVLTGDGAVLGGNRGISARNYGAGALSVTTGAGDVTGTASYGIFARNAAAGTNLTVLTGDRAVLGGGSGIIARNYGMGALSVTTVLGDVTGTGRDGIYARNNAGTNLTVLTGDGAVLGGNSGIFARNMGTGALSVTTGAGDVTGTAYAGIYAFGFGGTGVTVLTGDGAVFGGRHGIYAGKSGTGVLSVTTGLGDVTGGDRGILARNAGAGALSVTTGAGAVTGTVIYGIDARNSGTGLTVLTGDGAVLGGNVGLAARNSGTGVLSVTTGLGAVTGTAYAGILARNYAAGAGLTVVTGDGAVTGGHRGIHARNYGMGALSVTTGAGDVTGTSYFGIVARNAAASTNLTVLTGDGAVLGGRTGIYARNYGTGALSVTTGAGDVTGTAYNGIYVRNSAAGVDLTVLTGDGAVLGGDRGISARNYGTGALSVTTGAGNVTGTVLDGILAVNSFGTDATVLTGDGAVLGGQRGIVAINFGAGTGALSVTTGAGSVTGTAYDGIYARNSGTNLTVLTGDGAVLGCQGGISAYQLGSGDFSITVGGLVSNTALNVAGEAVRTYGKGVTLETLAAGNITGRITTAAGLSDDIFDNGGLWISNGTSDFGGGTNQVNNSGTVRSANTANTSEVTSFANAGVFTNLAGGVLTLADETAGNGSMTHDQLTIFGNFAGGGTLALDAFLGGPGSTADVLTIEGDVTGVTGVVVTNTNPGSGTLNPDGITIVTYAGTAAEGAFILPGGPISAGLFAYDIEHDSLAKIFELIGTGISAESAELATLVSVAQAIWHDTGGVLGDRFDELRGDINGAAVVGQTLVQPASYSAAANAGVWGKVVGRTLERDASSSLSYDLDVTGLIVGVDGVVNDSVAGGVLALGVTGGYVAAWQDFDSGSEADYEGFSGGLYATYVNGGFHLDSEFHANFLDVDYTMAATPTSDSDVTSLGGSVEAAYRMDVTNAFYVEPVARLAYVDTTIRDGDVLGVAFSGDGESLRGAVGVNLGGILNGTSDIVLKPELTAKIVGEFDGNNRSTFSGFTVSDDTPETYGEVGLSLEAISLSRGWSGHLNSDIQFADHFTAYGGYVGLRKNF